MAYKSAAGVLMMMAAIGFTGCNGGDPRYDRDHAQDHPQDRADEHRDQPRDARPSDHDHDAPRDERPRDDRPRNDKPQ